MSETLTQVDEPQIVDAPDGVSIDRWTKYGHDRLYISGARIEPYVDLQDGSVNDTGRVRVNSNIDGDTMTIKIGIEDGESAHQTIIISLSGDVSTSDSNTDNAEPTAEHIEEAGYPKAAGQAQQHEANQLTDDDDLMTDGGKDMTDAVAKEFEEAHGSDVTAESFTPGVIQVIVSPDHDAPIQIDNSSNGALSVESVTLNTKYAESDQNEDCTRTLAEPSTVMKVNVDLSIVSENYEK